MIILHLLSVTTLAVEKCDLNCAVCHLFDHQVSAPNCNEVDACTIGWHCVECKEGYELWFEKCLAPCPVGQYRSGYSCLHCPPNCDECSGPLDHECIHCSSTHELDNRHLCVKKCESSSYAEFVPTVGSQRCHPLS